MSDSIDPKLGWNDSYRKNLIKFFASEDKRINRINTCESCDNLKLYFCKLCNCYMPFKTRVETSVCPDNKW